MAAREPDAERGARPEPVLLITRPADRGAAFAEAVRGQLSDPPRVVIAPLVRIACLAPPPDLAPDATVLFTSASAVGCLGAGFEARGRRAFCVGARTAEAAMAAGFDAVSADGDAAALADLVLRSRPSGPLVHLRGEHAAADLARHLTEAGLPTAEHVLYRQEDVAMDAAAAALLAAPGRVVAPVFSPRGARRLAAVAAGRRATLHLVAISAAAARAFEPPPERIDVAARPSGAEMLAAVLRALDRGSPC